MSTIEQPRIASRHRRGRVGRAGAASVAALLACTRRLRLLQAPTTRRGLQQALGLLWLLDGVLQLQPFMLGKGFARQILAPAADGQPHLVAGPAHWSANLIAAHPVVWDVPFAATQLLLGIGLLVSRTARPALAASVAWAAGVWFFGEALSGLATGNASLLSGAPGAVLLYAVLALAAWPQHGRSDLPPRRWLPLAWAGLWVGAAIIQVLPENSRGLDIANAIRANGAPRSFAGLENSLTGSISQHGMLTLIVVLALETLVGLAAFDRRTLPLAIGAGLVFSLLIWMFSQNFGALYTGEATDPNTAPLIALMAIALIGLASDARGGEPLASTAEWLERGRRSRPAVPRHRAASGSTKRESSISG